MYAYSATYVCVYVRTRVCVCDTPPAEQICVCVCIFKSVLHSAPEGDLQHPFPPSQPHSLLKNLERVTPYCHTSIPPRPDAALYMHSHHHHCLSLSDTHTHSGRYKYIHTVHKSNTHILDRKMGEISERWVDGWMDGLNLRKEAGGVKMWMVRCFFLNL